MKLTLTLFCLSAFFLCGEGSWFWGSRRPATPRPRPSHDIGTQSGLTALYNKRVTKAERMERPLQGILGKTGLPHAGVRVTTSDGELWLVHKTKTNGQSDTVVTKASHMSSEWSVKETKYLTSSKTISDFVKAGGTVYNLFINNCWNAARRMMAISD